MPTSRKVLEMEKQFAREYALDLDRTRAAIAAGYSPATAAEQGGALLRRPRVSRMISSLTGERLHRLDITADRILEELARLGLSDLRGCFDEEGRLLPVHEMDDATAAAVASVEVVERRNAAGEVEFLKKIKLWDKTKALETLAKYFGLLRNEMEVTHRFDLIDPTLLSDDDLKRLAGATSTARKLLEAKQVTETADE